MYMYSVNYCPTVYTKVMEIIVKSKFDTGWGFFFSGPNSWLENDVSK